jgi:hypothetical protein
MFRHLRIVLDPSPRESYTYEDTVSGRVVFESPREEKICWVYVFFHGWAHAEITRRRFEPEKDGIPEGSTLRDKEIPFQNHQKVYEGHVKLEKKVLYEWPFRFRFQDERPDADSLPTSGKYVDSAVEYKIVAILGHVGDSDEHIRWMLNPNDWRYQKESTHKASWNIIKSE